MKNNTKATRGRPRKTVNFNGFKGSFTIDSVLKRANRGKANVSRATVYNHLMELIGSRKAKELKDKRTPGKGKGHPTYRYQLNAPRKAKATAPAAE